MLEPDYRAIRQLVSNMFTVLEDSERISGGAWPTSVRFSGKRNWPHGILQTIESESFEKDEIYNTIQQSARISPFGWTSNLLKNSRAKSSERLIEYLHKPLCQRNFQTHRNFEQNHQILFHCLLKSPQKQIPKRNGTQPLS